MSILNVVHSVYDDILQHMECPSDIQQPIIKEEAPSGIDKDGLVEQVSIECTCPRCLILVKLMSIKYELIDICGSIVGEENVQ